ncbi:hypothetical protein KEM52_004078, partial [Ascosphaera acerosa]
MQVTDSRDPSSKKPGQGKLSGLVSLDNVLQYTSNVPSMHSRYPLAPHAKHHPQQPSLSQQSSSAAQRDKRLSLVPDRFVKSTRKQAAVGPPNAARVTARSRLPPRTTKTSEKLVLLPETVPEEGSDEGEETTSDEAEDEDGEAGGEARAKAHLPDDKDKARARDTARRQKAGRRNDFDEDNEAAPLTAEEETLRRRRVPAETAKSYAERLPKARRAEKLPRVTAYCTAQAYKLRAIADFVREHHGARTKLYDDCLYAAYHLPLLPGRDGYRLRSSPPVKTVGGKAVLDEAIERNEQRDYHEEYMDEAQENEHSVAGSFDDPDHAGKEQH